MKIERDEEAIGISFVLVAHCIPLCSSRFRYELEHLLG